MEIKQYQIILVSLDTTVRDKPEKSRPCVVISPDEMNKHLRTIIIAPLAFDSASYPTRIKIKYDSNISRVVLDQIMTIERQRTIKVLGELSGAEIKKIKTILKETFVD